MDSTAREDMIAAKQERFPRTVHAIRQFLAAGDFMKGSLEHVAEAYGDLFWTDAERLLEVFARFTDAEYQERLQSLPRYTYEYLKAQIAYTRRKSYAKASFEDARQAVYDNAEVMRGFYLDGLLLTQAFWPGHLLINRFFRETFISRLADAVHFCEIGVGHGWFFTEALLAHPRASAVGLDVSPFSLDYTRRLASARGIVSTRFELRHADAQTGLGIEPEGLDAVICGEVLEHVERPDQLVRSIHQALRPGGFAYFTAPVQSDAVDHVYEFRSPQEVCDLMAEGGLRLLDKLEIPLSDFVTSGRAWDPTILVSLVARKETE